jgi:hypothetical protein
VLSGISNLMEVTAVELELGALGAAGGAFIGGPEGGFMPVGGCDTEGGIGGAMGGPGGAIEGGGGVEAIVFGKLFRLRSLVTPGISFTSDSSLSIVNEVVTSLGGFDFSDIPVDISANQGKTITLPDYIFLDAL